MTRTSSCLLTLTLALAPLGQALAAPSAIRSQAGLRVQDPFPMTWSGEGMVLSLQSLDRATGTLSGTVSLAEGAPLPLSLTIAPDETGSGTIIGARGPEPVTTRDDGDSTLVTFRGLTFRLNEVAPAGSGAGAAAPAENGGSLPKTWRLVQHTLRDKSWNNQPSHTILAPKGWKVEGGAWYPPMQAFKSFASHEVKLTAPDGSMIFIDPDMNFIDQTMMTMQGEQRSPDLGVMDGMLAMHYPQSPRAFADRIARDFMPKSLPNARNIRLVEVRDVPELTQAVQATLPPVRAQFKQLETMTPGMRTEVEGRVLGIEYSYEEGGRTWSHVTLFALTAVTMRAPSLSGMLGAPGTDTNISWSVTGSFSFRAQQEQLEDTALVAMTVRNSLRPTQPWLQMQARHRAQIQKISHEVAMDNLRTSAKIANITAQANSDIADMRHRGYQNRQAIRDEGHARQVNSIHEVHEYQVPGASAPVALPSHYDRVFSNGQGEFLLTNDALYEPGSDASLDGNWAPVQRVR